MKTLDEKAKEEGLDRSTVLRKLLEDAVKRWKIEKAAKLYKEGRISLSEAAKIAELPIDEMITELVKRDVRSDLTAEEYRESLKEAFELFGTKRRKR
jgi:predicted HTH domain antitoxin